MLDKRFHADNRVISRVVRLAKLPVQTGCKPVAHNRRSRTADSARIQRYPYRTLSARLNDPAFGLGLPSGAPARTNNHRSLPSQHPAPHHVAVTGCPATAEVIDITAFTLHAATGGGDRKSDLRHRLQR